MAPAPRLAAVTAVVLLLLIACVALGWPAGGGGTRGSVTVPGGAGNDNPTSAAHEAEAGAHARRLQTTGSGTVLTMGGAATAQAGLAIGSTRDYSWLLVDSTLNHTFTLRDTRTTSCLFSNCPNRYTVAIGGTSPPAGYSNGVFTCPTSGTNVLCRAYNVRPGGNAAAAFNVKQAQGYGQSASWMYARITCSNSGLGAKA
jgi:hypothetical protein